MQANPHLPTSPLLVRHTILLRDLKIPGRGARRGRHRKSKTGTSPVVAAKNKGTRDEALLLFPAGISGTFPLPREICADS